MHSNREIEHLNTHFSPKYALLPNFSQIVPPVVVISVVKKYIYILHTFYLFSIKKKKWSKSADLLAHSEKKNLGFPAFVQLIEVQ